MPRTTSLVTTRAFVADAHSIDRSTGRQIDWTQVTATNADGKKFLVAGTVVGELAGAGRVAPRVATTNPAIGILETDAVEDERFAALSGYGVMKGGILYENLLPDATGTPKTLSAAIKTELNAAGNGFAFEQYGDSR